MSTPADVRSIGSTLTDVLDDLIKNRRIEPQLAVKIITNFDKAIADVLSEKVKSRMSFKVHPPCAPHVKRVAEADTVT